MCGIVGAVAKQNVLPILLDGLRRLEYRGYDSAGVALIDNEQAFARTRTVGRVKELEAAVEESPIQGTTGIAHTRWATHGPPTQRNAHPHVCRNTVAVVCNGIVENFDQLREQQMKDGYEFTSETDTEVVVHEIYGFIEKGFDLLEAVKNTIAKLEGAYAIGVISNRYPNQMIGARRGSPLVVGIKDGEAFLGSDMAALIAVTNQFIVLNDGDVVQIDDGAVTIYNEQGEKEERSIFTSSLQADAVELGDYRHYMQKEIFEQGRAVADTLEGRVTSNRLLEETFGPDAKAIFDKTQRVQIIACGTSYHAGLVARHWFESFGLACDVEIASEFRSRPHVVQDNTLVVTISQSGETIDTLTALADAKKLGFAHSLTICNAPESSLVRESDLVFMTHAGPEIGVASTKAFTTQLTALLLLVIALGRRNDMDDVTETRIVKELRSLPATIEKTLKLDKTIQNIAQQFADKQHALFLGRGQHYPIAMEGALKLKEISYIHAEAYPAGELKHGPLALVDSNMPVVAVAPNDQLLEKIKSNIQEVRARGGRLLVFADPVSGIEESDGLQVLNVAPVDNLIAPIVYTIPLQLLSYHVALIKGTDVDKPRNLAKSVTVE
ncbi:MAG: glutamine--fructose-6-phosphate transaminase (isomerizing) [Gammaproteobacteria bacterium]|nr:glutamine--fructose-6-phosphate transaminase (isomerizing) [Gammaproteobacteria bacterium]